MVSLGVEKTVETVAVSGHTRGQRCASGMTSVLLGVDRGLHKVVSSPSSVLLRGNTTCQGGGSDSSRDPRSVHTGVQKTLPYGTR